MRRFVLSVLLVVGVALIVAPLSMSMFSRAGDGEKMVNQFRPIMQPASVQTTANYYYEVFTKLRPIALAMNQQTIDKFNGYLQGMKAMGGEAQKLLPALQAMHLSPAQFQKQFPAMAAMIAGLPQMEKDFGGLLGMMAANVTTFKRVPPGLDHYKPLVDTMQANVGTYHSVDSLPRMGLFPWFFILPGALIILASLYLLVGDINPELVRPKLTPKTPKTLAY